MRGGFSLTKRVLEDRECLSVESLKGQKLVTSAIKAAGGTDKIPITVSMMNEVKFASSRKKEADKLEKERKRKTEEDAATEAEAKKKKDEEAAEYLNKKLVKHLGKKP